MHADDSLACTGATRDPGRPRERSLDELPLIGVEEHHPFLDGPGEDRIAVVGIDDDVLAGLGIDDALFDLLSEALFFGRPLVHLDGFREIANGLLRLGGRDAEEELEAVRRQVPTEGHHAVVVSDVAREIDLVVVEADGAEEAVVPRVERRHADRGAALRDVAVGRRGGRNLFLHDAHVADVLEVFDLQPTCATIGLVVSVERQEQGRAPGAEPDDAMLVIPVVAGQDAALRPGNGVRLELRVAEGLSRDLAGGERQIRQDLLLCGEPLLVAQERFPTMR